MRQALSRTAQVQASLPPPGAPIGAPAAPVLSVNTEGRNRLVLLTRRHAIKLPSLRSWRDFLFGLLNNLNERAWHRDHEACCPVRWAAPLGLALVMPRAQVLDDTAFACVAADLPDVAGAERKASSWGWLDGRLVAVDYGWR